jgi:phage terminase large subunit GpA-like protein
VVTTSSPPPGPPAKSVAVHVPASVRAIVAPPERLSVCEWTERHRILQERHAAQPGPYRFDVVPYMREPHDAFTDPGVGTITVIKASRAGGTEYLNNLMAYSADARPMPMMYVLPREPDVNEEFRGRIRGIFEASPRLQRHIPGGNWATDDVIALDTMTILGAAATKAGDFIRRTTGLNLFDEVDNCEKAAGRLGNIWALLLERLTTYGHRGKQVGVTTPTTEDASAWKAWLVSDQRKWWVPCRACGVYQLLTDEQIKIPDDVRDPDLIDAKELAWYECEGCKAKLDDPDRLWMVARGVWVPACQTIVGKLNVSSHADCEAAALYHDQLKPEIKGDPPFTRNRGYWFNCLVSPWRSLSDTMAKFLRVKDDPHEYKVYVNSWRALPWKESSQTTEVDDLRKLAQLGPPGDIVPAEAIILLAGADVQGNRIYYVIEAYGPNEESWHVKDGIVESFEELWDVCFRSRYSRAGGSAEDALACTYLGIDSGHRTAEVYDFHLSHPAEVVVLKGGHDTMAEKWSPSLVDYYPNGKRNPHSVRLFHVNGGFYKEKLHGMVRKKEGDRGKWHLNADCSEQFFKEFTAEEQIYERPSKKRAKGRWVWKVKAEGRPNHRLDCMVYATVLADIKNCRNLPPRQVLEAQRSAAVRAAAVAAAGGGPQKSGIRTRDGRPFLVTQRGK